MRLVAAKAGQMSDKSTCQEGPEGPCVGCAWLVHPQSLWYGRGCDAQSAQSR